MKEFFKNLILTLTPNKVKHLILLSNERYKHLQGGDAQITYSQQGEDLELSRIFPESYKGFYIDVGAFHPVKYSNTYKLYKNGWNGINIEPNPDQLEQFKLNRKRDINLNIGISKTEGILKYYNFNEPAVNTFVEANAKTWSEVNGFKITSVKEIFTKPLVNVFETYVQPRKKIDLMNVDVEGMDIEVLKSNDWQRFRPYAVLAEDVWYNKNSLQESEVHQFMYAQQYRLWNIVGITMFFVDTTVNLQ